VKLNVVNQFNIFLSVNHQTNNNLALEIAGKMDPAGVGPATKHIQAQIQFGYESGFKRIAAVYLVNL
jgi:bisphosphoglycerate-independent phosphoglycerate mutase (AlkP superfamily)